MVGGVSLTVAYSNQFSFRFGLPEEEQPPFSMFTCISVVSIKYASAKPWKPAPRVGSINGVDNSNETTIMKPPKANRRSQCCVCTCLFESID